MFGHDGWSSEVIEQSCESRTEGNPAKWMTEAVCRVRVTVFWVTSGAPTSHDGTGFGGGDKRNTRAEAMEKAVKEAETDALKRALRIFGEALGNCLYSKPYLSWIEKVRAREGKQDETKHYTADILVRKPRSGGLPSSQSTLSFPRQGSLPRPGRQSVRALPTNDYYDDEELFEDVGFEP
ncbi:rad52/22 family double-strand break repair protein [Hirsutella rhossiliensis]|uniref:Rad52/22 family double-strand break repair protein n=1 Tax=Hirsutella rhossiliensis TaxID=111463 RepID=A0A9P8N4L0_9HYPO|nr:rad52/22 family double-strand break repair protein [Hirsutella rhossiliensis]KAH0966714.1 rad52/22 family double-strand break repair protein [Hirsutella rhossiliensis]